jgi:hypothetical protein
VAGADMNITRTCNGAHVKENIPGTQMVGVV